ncbi:MAG: kinase-like domain-containing protein [Monoraphidium minutum]|nr:MAG: kinase-like domain-containing protein [Monoraphidium minutum]
MGSCASAPCAVTSGAACRAHAAGAPDGRGDPACHMGGAAPAAPPAAASLRLKHSWQVFVKFEEETQGSGNPVPLFAAAAPAPCCCTGGTGACTCHCGGADSSAGSSSWASALRRGVAPTPPAARAAPPSLVVPPLPRDAEGGPELWSVNCSSWLQANGGAAEDACEELLSEEFLAAALSGAAGRRGGGAAAATGAAGGGEGGPWEDEVDVPALCRLDSGGAPWGAACGGGAEVYRSLFNNAPAAVKILRTCSGASESLVHAVEMAVLSSVHHPNIVAAYACLPDMLLLPPPPPPAPPRLRLRAALPGDAPEAAAEAGFNGGGGGAPCDVVMLELCDQGSLRAALGRGALGGAAGGGGGGNGGGGGAAGVLLDVAAALEFLHAMNLVHGGVNSDNVLLKSDASRPHGLHAKLGGFGRAKILDQDGLEVNAAQALGRCRGAGAAAAAAKPPPPPPELPSDHGSCRSAGAGGGAARAADVHAFGLLILEILHASQGPRRAAPAAPAPAAAPAPCPLRALAADCLSDDPARRPPMAGVLARLEPLAALSAAAAPRRAAAPPVTAARAAAV